MHKVLLGVILLIAVLLRIVNLGDHPIGFTPDEASFGYDAYSILKSGRDQWRTVTPLSFQSFGDYKLPLYTYLVIPSVKIFGLNEFAVRLPNALLGSLAVLATFLLVNEYFKSTRSSLVNHKSLALLSAFLLAISPWHIPLSRGAFEANLTSFFMPLGLYFFFRGLQKKVFFLPAAILLGLNLFTYHSARILTPLVVLFLVWQYGKQIKKSAHLYVSVGIFLFLAGIGLLTLLGGAGSRAATAGIFSESIGDQRYKAVLTGQSDFVARLFFNRVTHTTTKIVENYISYYSPQFLFSDGPAEGTYGMVPGHGVLYLIEMFFLMAFFWAICVKRVKDCKWLVFWLLIAPLAASIAKGPGYAANRVAFALPALQIVSAIGAFALYGYVIEKVTQKRLAKRTFVSILSIILIVQFAFFLQTYFVNQRVNNAQAMIYGVRKVLVSIAPIEQNYTEIIISKKISEPHIYVAFYNKIDPEIVQQQSLQWADYKKQNLGWVDQLGSYSLGKYTFKSIDWIADSRKVSALLIGEPSDFPADVVPLMTIDYPDLKPAYYVVSTLNQEFASR